MRRWTVVATVSASVLFVACSPLLIRNEATRDYVPLHNASLELHRDVIVPPGKTRVFFQDGVVQPGINEYRPHCELTVRNLIDQPQTIYAGHFTVENVSADLNNGVLTVTVGKKPEAQAKPIAISGS